jgi:prepilin peptidase CpaA
MTYSEAFQLASFIALFALLIVCAYTDITRNKVYNWCTFPGIGAGLALAYLAGGVSSAFAFNLINSLLGLAAGGGIILLFSLFGGIGLGDVKLMAAVGALTGFPFVLFSLLYSSMIGFAIAVGFLIWRGDLRSGLMRSLKFAIRWKSEKAPDTAKTEPQAGAKRPPDTIPFGAAIAFGTLWAFFLSMSGI